MCLGHSIRLGITITSHAEKVFSEAKGYLIYGWVAGSFFVYYSIPSNPRKAESSTLLILFDSSSR